MPYLILFSQTLTLDLVFKKFGMQLFNVIAGRNSVPPKQSRNELLPWITSTPLGSRNDDLKSYVRC